MEKAHLSLRIDRSNIWLAGIIQPHRHIAGALLERNAAGDRRQNNIVDGYFVAANVVR